jgi:hypothetical protein
VTISEKEKPVFIEVRKTEITPRKHFGVKVVVIRQEGRTLRNSFHEVVPPTCNLPGGLFF